MKLAAVYIKDGEYGSQGDIGRIGEYADAQEAYRKNASDLGRPYTVAWMEVPEGMDERTIVAQQKTPSQASFAVPGKAASGSVGAKAASVEYENVVYTAQILGAAGNSISLVFDGVKDIATVVSEWNAANVGNEVMHDASDDTVVPAAGTADLAGGYDGFNLNADSVGLAGNLDLVFDGVKDLATVVSEWNAANPSNTVSHDGVGTIVPDAQTASLSGGYDAFAVTADDQDEEGNLADFSFDGVQTLDAAIAAWNDANPTNTVSHNHADGSIVPDAQALDLEGGESAGWELVVDAGKQAAAIAQDKAAQIAVKYREMDDDVLAEMQTVFGTSRTDSALAEERTWEKWLASPSTFSGAGLKVRVAHGTFNPGDALDTDQKVTDYATAALAAVETFGINRQLRIQQFLDEKAAIEAS